MPFYFPRHGCYKSLTQQPFLAINLLAYSRVYRKAGVLIPSPIGNPIQFEAF